MRFNLSRYHCAFLELSSESKLPLDKDAEIQAFMNLTHTHDVDGGDKGDPRTAFFGSKTKSSGISHLLQGRLTRVPNASEIGIRVSISIGTHAKELPAPPRSYKPVSLLVGATTKLFGPIEVKCHAIFEYDQKEGYRSKISFPMPLMVQEEASGITHIDGAQFSRRDKDNTDYQIVVASREDSDLFIHSVIFDSTIELNRTSIRNLMSRARLISNQLLIRPGEA